MIKFNVFLISFSLCIAACSPKLSEGTYFKQAEIAVDSFDYTLAIKYLDDALEINSEYDSALVLRAICSYNLEKYDNALIDLDKALELDQMNSVAHLYKGYTLSDLGELVEATISFNLAYKTASDGQVREAILGRAFAYYWLQEYEKALLDFNELLLLDSNDVYALENRGLLKSQMNIYSKVKDSLAINWDYYVKNFVINMMAENKYVLDTKGAIEDYTSALSIQPNYARVLYLRSIAYKDLGLDSLALIDITKAIEYNPTSNYYVTRGLIYKAKYKSDLALEDFNEAIKLDPQNSNAYFNRAYLKKEQLNDPEGAEFDLKYGEKYLDQGVK